ncbi:extracellular solute-binding protein [Myxococcota bacterium]|nr:extracellular solute-binding protein [Myxococcota bacterium]
MRRPLPSAALACLAAVALAGLACRVELGPPGGRGAASGGGISGELWVYTSMYEEVVRSLEPLVAARYPDLDVRFFQAGSEKVSQRLEAELAGGGSPADLVLTSDPFWYEQARREGRLLRYASPESLRIPREYLDLDGYWATSRLSLMVLAAHGERVPEAERPRRFADLAEPRFRDRVTTGDPLASGTNLTLLAFLQAERGWDFYRRLRGNGLVAAGGNSAVLTRIESGERPVGAILLENLLAARENRTPAVTILPEDGAVTIPGPIAILAGTDNPEAAKAVYDLVLSPEGQRAIVAGRMYSPRPDVPPPEGAPPLGSFPVKPWTEDFVGSVVDGREALVRTYEAVRAGR